MLKKALFLLMTLIGLGKLSAQDLPQASTAENPVWYLMQFLNGGEVLIPTSEKQNVNTQPADGKDTQLWRLEGDATSGYKFINKKGMMLYTDKNAKNGMVKASATATTNNLFQIVATTNSSYAGGFEIQPKGVNQVSFNQFGGPQTHQGIGLWDKGDPNNPLKFVSLKDFENIGKIAIIPYPQQLTVTKEGQIDFKTFQKITYTSDTVKLHVTQFAEMVKKTSGIALSVEKSGNNDLEKAINLKTDTQVPAEGYTLTTEADKIVITASDDAGFFYALQSLKQMLPRAIFEKQLQDKIDWTLPYVTIKDQPALGYRGYMLDVSRHFFSKEEVKRILDVMALYKMNRFHWHLTDDQGWRIQMEKYPRLTEVGSIRNGSFVSNGASTKFFDDTEYGRGMWYTKEDLKEIVAYAKERHIEILPEVDFPAHMGGAIAAYPEFSCNPEAPHSVRVDAGISTDVLNVGNEKVITFLKDVMDYLAEVFPYPYIHMGGDECPTTEWANNKECLDLVKREGLSGVNEIQSWLIEQLGIYIKEKHGKDCVAWDELLSHWRKENTVKPVIMAWNSINKSAEAANKGFKSIVSPHSHLYFDMMQVPANQRFIDEPYCGGWNDSKVVSLPGIYGLNPVSALPANKVDFCMGVQGNMWTETTNDSVELEFQLLPRLLGLAEIGWLNNSQKDWLSFHKRLQNHDDILEAMDMTYAKHYFDPNPQSDAEKYLSEGAHILKEAIKNGAGYPEAACYEALEKAWNTLNADTTNTASVEALKEAIQAYKNAPVVQPQEGKIYQIVSASTFYKRQYAGSTLYQKDNNMVRFHYTPQVEPEELWQFVKSGDRWILKNYASGKVLKMGNYNTKVTLEKENGTEIRLDKPAGLDEVDFMAGALLISDVKTYAATSNGKAKRLSAEPDGFVYDKDEAAVCHPGAWKLVEISDFKKQLDGLVYKANRIMESAQPGEAGEPTEEALDFLQNKLIVPATEDLKGGLISEETYRKYVSIYNQFLAMPKNSILNQISTEHYYKIQNAYFTTNYAGINGSKQIVPKTWNNNDAGLLWYFTKDENGTVKIFNKSTKKAAFITNATEGATIMASFSGQGESDWTLTEIKTDQNSSGIAIVENSNTYSWYTNPAAFKTIILKPKDWGASIWNLIKGDKIPPVTGIDQVTEETSNQPVVYYDLGGRKIDKPTHGIYITNQKKKVLIP